MHSAYGSYGIFLSCGSYDSGSTSLYFFNRSCIPKLVAMGSILLIRCGRINVI